MVFAGAVGAFLPPRRRAPTKYAIIRDVRPSNTMRSTAPFAVSAAPAEAGHDMNAEAAYTVEKFTVADPFVPR